MWRNTVKRDNGTLKCLFTFCKNFVHVYNVFWSNHSHFPLPQMPSLPLFLSNFKLFLKSASIPVSICLSVSLVLKTSASTYCCLLGIWVWNTFLEMGSHPGLHTWGKFTLILQQPSAVNNFSAEVRTYAPPYPWYSSNGLFLYMISIYNVINKEPLFFYM